MARFVQYRTAAVTGISAATTFTIPGNTLPAPRPGASLVGLAFQLASATFDVADISRIRLRNDNDVFYDQSILHERLFQERFCYRDKPVATTSGGTATTYVGAGGFNIWLNDQRAMTPDFQDKMAAPLGRDVTIEIELASAPASGTGTINVGAIYSTVTPEKVCRRTSMVINLANGVTSGTRNIDERGYMIAYGIPHLSLTIANTLTRWKMRTGGVDIFDGSIPVAILTELDEADWASSGTLAAAGAGVVLWKSTRGIERPGGDGSSRIEVDTNGADLTSVVMPIWSWLPQ